METAVINGFGHHLDRSGGYANGHVMAVDPDNQPHREMAIDCPAGFIGGKKEPPRYPPPLRDSPAASPFRPPAAADIPYIEAPQASEEEERQNKNRVRRAQEELRKRRQAEEKLAREELFLSTSLRDSQKLRQLRERQVDPTCFDNPNYSDDERASFTIFGQFLNRESLIGIVSGIQERLKSEDDLRDTTHLSELMTKPQFLQALSVHNKIISTCNRLRAPPVSDSGQALAKDILNMTDPHSNPDMKELHALLDSLHISSVLLAHDGAASDRLQLSPANTTHDEESDFIFDRVNQYGEDSIKIVRLQKTTDPLGATVRNDGESVIIGRIVKGGAAEKSGLLHEGDEILEINGVDIRGKSISEVCDIMANLTGTLSFLIIPQQELAENNKNLQDVMHIKCHFSYDPEDDLYIPCRELGISFNKGDILHVINQTDNKWWQAYREGEEDQALAGLIPSRSFQQLREAERQTMATDSGKSGEKKKTGCHCPRKTTKKKRLYNPNIEEAEDEEILTYEEVQLYYPQPNRKRPVVLIGPPNVGRHEIRQRLMESDLDRFAAAVPHTSRPRKDDEVDGKDYHFVPRHDFQDSIAKHHFVEYGEFEKNLYGTSLEAIRQVVQSGKICILNLYPQSLKILKASDVKPFVVFIAPPNLETLKQIRLMQKSKVTDDELRDVIEKAREMEDKYGHYFDHVIVNCELDRAYEELISELNRLEVEPQWVPSFWLS